MPLLNVLFRYVAFIKTSFATTMLVYATLVLGISIAMRNERWRNAGLAALSVLLVLFCAEAYLRFVIKSRITYSEMHGQGYVSPYRADLADRWHLKFKEGRNNIHTLEWRPYEVRDNTTMDFAFPDYVCNELGLRGRLPVKGNKIVLAVGDSFTEGAGTPCDSTYPVLLEQRLQQYDADNEWSVINAGVSGNDPFFDWKMVQKLTARYQVSHIVFLLNTTDINDIQMRGGMERFVESGYLDYPDGPWWEPIYAISFVSRLFFHGFCGVQMNLMTNSEASMAKKRALSHLQRLFEDHVVPFSIERGIHVNVVCHPLANETPDPASDYGLLVQTLSDIRRISFLDGFTGLSLAGYGDQLYYPNDGHMTPLGYAMLSDLVFKDVWRTISGPALIYGSDTDIDGSF